MPWAVDLVIRKWDWGMWRRFSWYKYILQKYCQSFILSTLFIRTSNKRKKSKKRFNILFLQKWFYYIVNLYDTGEAFYSRDFHIWGHIIVAFVLSTFKTQMMRISSVKFANLHVGGANYADRNEIISFFPKSYAGYSVNLNK